ncbi:MAG: OmpH family outer membrane protein [Armatimonadota bacterium]|nr:OmpH family outer membrane protein [Armatimonadota bacterium]MDR7519317.1 OmpH family outer membrane protein [Armatimonadota bacterium]
MTFRHVAIATVLIGLLVAGAGCTVGRVGLVDSRRILTESAKALRYQKELDDRERAMAADLQLLANRLSREDLEARQLQYLRELQALRAELEETLNREVREAIQQVVRAKRLRGVLVKGPVIWTRPGAAVDITQDVIDRLK